MAAKVAIRLEDSGCLNERVSENSFDVCLDNGVAKPNSNGCCG